MTVTSHPDDRHITSGRPTYTIRICLSGSLTKVSKSCTSLQQSAIAHVHVPPPAEWKDRNEVTTKSLPTNLWQPRRLPRSLSAARRVMMALPPLSGIMTSQNISLPLKREQCFWYYTYMNLHTKKKVSLRYPVKDQLIYLSYHGWQNHRRVHPDAFCRNNWTRNVYWLRSCVHPFGNYVDYQGREASTLSIFSFPLLFY